VFTRSGKHYHDYYKTDYDDHYNHENDNFNRD
jgi:hypothetical protein